MKLKLANYQHPTSGTKLHPKCQVPSGNAAAVASWQLAGAGAGGLLLVVDVDELVMIIITCFICIMTGGAGKKQHDSGK